MWRLERPSVISHFEKLAAAEKAAHLQRYPGYRARNRRPAEIKRRNKNVTSIVVNKPAQASNKQTAAQLNNIVSQANEGPDVNFLSLSNSETEEMDLEKLLVAFNKEFDNMCAEADKISTATDNFAEKQSTQYDAAYANSDDAQLENQGMIFGGYDESNFGFNIDDYLNYQ